MAEPGEAWLDYEQEYINSLTAPSSAPTALPPTTTQDAEYFSDFAFFQDWQYAVLFVVGMISCILSLLGSILILYLVIEGKRTNELYHRLLLGLSISDIIVTISLLMQPILVPKETGYLFALGNSKTCAFVGFGYLFFIASYAYNCMLGVYFLATVRFWKFSNDKTNSCLLRYLEPLGHFVAFAMPIAIGSTAVHFGLLNPNPFLGVCSMFPSNHECEWKDDVDGGCQNDQQYNTLNSVLDYYAISLVAIGLLCTIGVYLTVKIRYGRKKKRSCCSSWRCCKPKAQKQNSCKILMTSGSLTLQTGPTSSPFDRSEDFDSDVESDDHTDTKPQLESIDETLEVDNEQDNVSCDTFALNPNAPGESANEQNEAKSDNTAQEMRVRQIATQAVCYAAAYLVGMVIVVVANAVDSIYLDENSDSLLVLGEEPLYFFVIFMVWLLFPLQGFFNAFIYIRPRWVRWKHHYEDASWWFAFKMVLTTESPPSWGQPTQSTHSRARKSSGRTSGRKKGSNGSKDKNGTMNGGKEDKLAHGIG